MTLDGVTHPFTLEPLPVTPGTSPERIMRWALEEMGRGHLRAAESLCRQGVEQAPQDAALIHVLGLVLHRQGRHLEALDPIHRSLSLRPETADFHSNLGSVLASLGRLAGAIKAFEQALHLAPRHPDAQANLPRVVSEAWNAGLWAASADSPVAGRSAQTVSGRVSCVMLTCGRPALLTRSVASYRRQAWPDRELIIVFDDPRLRPGLEALAGSDGTIRLVFVNERRPLGELRNIGAAQATGEFIVQWDDDDQYHPARIQTQIDRLRASGRRAGVLADQLLFFTASRQLVWIERPGGIEGTLACCAAKMLLYPPVGLAEDTVLARGYRKLDQLDVLPGKGYLYLRTCHGGNTWSKTHFGELRRSSRPRESLRQDLDLLLEHLPAYDLGSAPVEMHGREGRLGVYEPSSRRFRFG